MPTLVRELHGVLFDLAAFMNQPQRDAALLREANVDLDRALFPLLVAIDRRGPLGVVELAGIVGRDYTTVSRQVAVLERQKLIRRSASATDARSRLATVTTEGRKIIHALDTTRERLAKTVLASWTDRDLKELLRLSRRFADDLARIR